MNIVDAVDNREQVSLIAVREILDEWNPPPRKKSVKEKALSIGGVSVMLGIFLFFASIFNLLVSDYLLLISVFLISGGFCRIEYDYLIYSDVHDLPDDVILSLADNERVSVGIKKHIASVMDEKSTITMRELLVKQRELAEKERLQGQAGYQKIIKFKEVEVESERS